MTSFLEAFDGRIVNISAVEAIYRQRDGSYKLRKADDTLVGHIGCSREALDAATMRLIPAGPADILTVAHAAGDDCPAYIEQHKIIAWGFAPGCFAPEAITATEGIIRSNDYKIVAIQRPDGRYDVPFGAVYDNKAELLQAANDQAAAAIKARHDAK